MKKYALVLLAASTLMTAVPALATEQAQERQDGRQAKQECRDGLVGNADCRQEKRDIKH
ncbi:hypothetical protein OH773_13015 [Buttiauxella sp. WJP83]|uniref:hypothetical protein n=1 Tax=unclassified Buttiauxella TaxID=2634062 RepID=UPI0010E04E98|nr:MULTISPECIES: hypothetical protein [unclassified Buttiauxella]WBM69110.1 hypothetical protein OH773_13015 [Buttiauxella sp. WJP83]GDX06691.1 hypothetical protein BSPA111_29040 [Buttiauxella sp. A111]